MDRLWSKTERVESGCLEWRGAIDTPGYGAIKVDGKKVNTHRLAYQLTYGEIPKGMCVCHTCDNRLCVEPEHLWLGTRAQNNRDMAEKGRVAKNRKEYCKHGHLFTETEYLTPAVDSLGRASTYRQCLECKRRRSREHMMRKRAAEKEARLKTE